MSGRLEGKIAIITGGGSGIGAATARRFAAEGARVTIADIDLPAAERVAAEITAAGGEAAALLVDVSSAEAVSDMVSGVVEREGRLDVLHNNAFFNRMGTVGDFSPENWRRSLAVTLDGTFYGMHAALPVMRRQGSGAIINTASVSGMGGDYGMGGYNAAKAAVIGLTRTAAIEYARFGVRVNAVCPGTILTPPVERLFARTPAVRDATLASIPRGKLGTPEEIAAVVLFLASDEAALVVGACIVADGGLSAWTGQPALAPDLLERG